MLVKVDFYMLESVIYSCDGKSEFTAAITPVFSVTWSFRKHSHMLLSGAQETLFLLLSKLKKIVLL